MRIGVKERILTYRMTLSFLHMQASRECVKAKMIIIRIFRLLTKLSSINGFIGSKRPLIMTVKKC